MPWISVAIETDDTHAQALSDALIELGALSADLHDAAAGTEREQPLFDEPGEPKGQLWRTSELTALFDEAADIPSILHAATDAAGLSFRPTIARRMWKSRIGFASLSRSLIPSTYPRACGSFPAGIKYPTRRHEPDTRSRTGFWHG